jgi:hypothetical protein
MSEKAKLSRNVVQEYETCILLLRKTLNSHAEFQEEINKILFLNLQRCVLAAKNKSSVKVNDKIRNAEHSIQLYETFSEVSKKDTKNIRMVNKMRYHLADLYTKDIMAEFEESENQIKQFYLMKSNPDYENLIEQDVQGSFDALSVKIKARKLAYLNQLKKMFGPSI